MIPLCLLFVALLTRPSAGALPQHAAAASPAARTGHVMATAGPAGGVYLLGGDSPAGDAMWRLGGGGWQSMPPGGPTNRSMAAAAFDTKRGVLVVFGGAGIRSGSRYGDTWEFDGRTWVELDVRGPGARDHHAMAYDEARGQIVMYGGWDGDRRFLSETWTWNGSVWTRAGTTAAPGGIGHLAMAYDSRRQRVVMFGGDGPDRPATAETWEWDGASWTRVSTDGPGARTRHRLAYDAARGVTVLFGGQIGTGRDSAYPSDTWTWDGRAWTRFDAPGPQPRWVHGMAYDQVRERIVLFGGGLGASPFNRLADTWEWDGTRWSLLGFTPPTAETPEQMAERLLGAIGGRARWAAARNTVNDSQQNRIEEPTVVRSVITMDFTRPRFRIETTAPGLRVVRVIDGLHSWRLTRDGTIEDVPAALMQEDLHWYAGHVYRTLHRVAARDTSLSVVINAQRRLEVHEGGARIAWFALDVRGEPYAFGAHGNDVGTISGPWDFVHEGIHHPRWVSQPDGTWRAMVKTLAINAPLPDALFARPRAQTTGHPRSAGLH